MEVQNQNNPHLPFSERLTSNDILEFSKIFIPSLLSVCN